LTSDILYINKTQPYPEQGSEELGDDVVARLNPTTGEIENLEGFDFHQHQCIPFHLMTRRHCKRRQIVTPVPSF